MAERAAPRLASLLARFDERVLRAPAWPPRAAAAGGSAATAASTVTALLAQPPGAALLDWCHAAAPRLGVAALGGRGAAALAEALALQLDGSLRLQACRGGLARLALRLGVKCDDLALALGRAPRRSDCWDSGWLRDGPATLASLATWQPRRATLLLAGDRPPEARAALLAALAGRLPGHRPGPALRLLWVAEGPAPLAWQALA